MRLTGNTANNYYTVNKLTALAAAVALSGGLAACGGGGGSTDTSMMPTPQEMCEDAGGRYNADGSCTSATELQVEQLQAQIAALRTQLGLDPSENLSDSITELQNDLAALQKQVDDAAEEAAMAAKKAAAADAEALFTGMDADRDPAGADLVVDESLMAVTDTHGGSAAIAEATAGTTFLTTAPTGAVIAVEATDAMEPSLGAWKGTQLAGANDDDTISSTVVVYTDVEPNMSMPFDEVYGTASDLTIDADASSDAHVRLIMASGFNHAGVMDHAPDAGTGDDQVTVRVPGTFHGANGQYQCTADSANDCVSHEDDNGVRLTGAGTPVAAWTFVPNPGAMVSVADATYMYFGWWLHKDSTGPEVDAFHGITGSPTAIVEADFTALSGTATYSGAAAGKYAIDPVAPGTYASGGHWTADASLTADFGSETTDGTITGMVNNFMAGGEMMDWNVALGTTVLSAAGVFDTGTDTSDDTGSNAVVWTIASETAPSSGAWSGNLHNQGDNNIPTGASGEFSATYTEGGHNIGHIAGGFGAPRRRVTTVLSLLLMGGGFGRRPFLAMPSMIGSLEVEVLHPARWRRRISEAQRCCREAGSEGSAEQSRDPMDKNRIRGLPGRTNG